MIKKKKPVSLDDFGLVIIGSAASLLYYLLERATSSSQNLATLISVGAILFISILTQILLNNINRSRAELHEANETLETKVKDRTEELRKSENKYRAIFENTGTATIIIENDKTISLANSEFVNISGYKKTEIENLKSWTAFIDEKSHKDLLKKKCFPIPDTEPGAIIKHYNCEFIDRNNERKHTLISFAPIADEGGSVVSIADISELKKAEKKIYHQAFHDTLTNLPNKALFMEHLNMSIKRKKIRDDYYYSILYLDIDRFKLINNSFGHNTGDCLLLAFAERLQESLRDIDILARFGGDEFVIMLENIEEQDYAVNIADRLQKSLKKPFIINDKEIFAPASIGIVVHTKTYNDPEKIIRDADAAMNFAKEKGRGQYKIFNRKLHKRAIKLLEIETDLRKAIHRDEFELYYQPIVSLINSSLIGFEALIRWNHPKHGLTKPDHFIPIAEETGLIVPIGKWVLREACNHFVKWGIQAEGSPPLFISVNISSKQIIRPDIIDEIQNILEESGLPPESLKLEITETALMEETDEIIELINRLKSLGIQIAIDDFGTGYSSMSYLQHLPVDTLKVDRSFVSNIDQPSNENMNIVETIIDLARKLKINVVAEGVETPEQQQMLSDMNCHSGQGYFFSRPLNREKMEKLVINLNHLQKSGQKSSYRLNDLLSDQDKNTE